MSSDQTRLNDLLSVWEGMKAKGQTIAPEDLCQDTPELLEQVKRHIDALDAFDSVEARLNAPGAAAHRGVPQVPGYEIIEELGRGGMGVVYKALQPSLKRIVALKVIRKGLEASAEDLDRFRAEAEAVAGLQHENIVRIYEIGDSNGEPFFSLEFSDGGSLADKLDGTPRPAEEAAPFVAALARGMQAAHERGIVHRDLKPANILLKRAHADDPSLPRATPKITDFGLAKRLDQDSIQTRTGAILGTPAYMAPEQACGNTRRIGPAADIYSLGVILYELLTGRPPFKGTTLLDTLEQVRSAEPVPPRQLLPKLSLDLDTICLKCLSKEPHNRYVRADALAEDLEHYLRGEPIAARRAGLIERGYRWCRRKPALASLAALAAFTIAAGFAGAISFGVFQAGVADNLANKQTQLKIAAEELQNEQVKLKNALAQAQKNFDDLHETEKHRQRFAGTSAQMFLERGIAMCDKDGDAAGLLYMVGALQMAPHDPDLQHSIRMHLGVWSRWVHPLDAQLPHEGTVSDIAFRPDGKVFLTNDGAVRLWDAATLEPIGTPLRHEMDASAPPLKRKINACAFTPDSTKILTGAQDGTVRFWDAHTGAALGEPMRLQSPVEKLTVRPDGVAFLVRANENRLWDVTTRTPIGNPIHPKKYLGGDVSAFTPDGTRIVVGTGTDAAIWDAFTGLPIVEAIVVSPKMNIDRIVISPDSKTMLASSAGPVNRPAKAHLIDLATGAMIGAPIEHTNFISAIAFNPHGKTVVTGSLDCSARLFDAKTGKPFGGIMNHPASVLHVVFSPDGKYLLTACRGGAARLWDASTGTPMGPPLAHRADVTALAFSSDGKSFLTGSADQIVRRWRLADVCFPPESTLDFPGKFVGPTKVHIPGKPYFSPDGTKVVRRDTDDNLRLWDVVSAKPISAPLPPPYGKGISPNQLQPVFSADGKVLVYGCNDKARTIRAWDTATGKPVGPPIVPDLPMDRFVLSPTGRHILTGPIYREGDGEIWDTITGQRLWVVPGGRTAGKGFSHDGQILVTTADKFRFLDVGTGKKRFPEVEFTSPISYARNYAWSPKGNEVLLQRGSPADQIYLWNLDAGRSSGPALPHHSNGFLRTLFSPDGQVLITQNRRVAFLWNARTCQPIGKPVEHESDITGLVLNPAATILATASSDRTVRLWDVATGRPTSPPLAHPGTAIKPAFSPDGKILLTGGPEFARLWESPSGRPLGPRLPVFAGPDSLFFHPDGQIMIVAHRRTFDGVNRLWNDSAGVRAWPTPTPITGRVDQLMAWVEFLTGQELGPYGRPSVLDRSAWQERRELLKRNALN